MTLTLFFTTLGFSFLSALLTLSMLFSNEPGSDHFIHLNIIKRIKQNKHRFILSFDNFLYSKDFFYPQLVHWIFSFVKASYAKYASVPFSFLSTFLFNLFLVYLNNNFFHYDNSLYIIANIIYIFNPYNIFPINAKNVSFSCRGIGLLLGQLFNYLLVILMIGNFHSTPILFASLSVLILLTFLSNAFAIQFVIFSCFFFAIIFFNLVPLLSLLTAAIFFLLCFNKSSNLYFKSQLQFKIFYAKTLSPHYLLKARYSIWRDLIFDIWLKLTKFSLEGIKYVASNSIIILFLGFPFLVISLLVYFKQDFSTTRLDQTILIYPILSSLLMFLLTSTRLTRFLGEPERYLEFCIPFIAIFCAYTYKDHSFLFLILIIYSVGLTIFQIVFTFSFSGKMRDKSLSTKDVNTILEMLHRTNKSIRLFSNNGNNLKYFAAENISLFYGFFEEYIGKHKWIDVFEYYPIIRENMIPPLTRDFSFTHLLIDNRYCKSVKNDFFYGLDFTKINENISLYEVN